MMTDAVKALARDTALPADLLLAGLREATCVQAAECGSYNVHEIRVSDVVISVAGVDVPIRAPLGSLASGLVMALTVDELAVLHAGNTVAGCCCATCVGERARQLLVVKVDPLLLLRQGDAGSHKLRLLAIRQAVGIDALGRYGDRWRLCRPVIADYLAAVVAEATISSWLLLADEALAMLHAGRPRPGCDCDSCSLGDGQ